MKLLSRVVEVNSIEHQLRSQAQATFFPLPTRFEREVFVPTFLVFKQCLFTADFRGRRRKTCYMYFQQQILALEAVL